MERVFLYFSYPIAFFKIIIKLMTRLKSIHLHQFAGTILAFVGYILSPLSWWNDLVVNFPLSYLLALPFALINKKLFIPAFISAYWMTNIVGLLLMQKGGKKALFGLKAKSEFKKEIKNTLIWGSLYTILIMVLVLSGILTFPIEFLEKIK